MTQIVDRRGSSRNVANASRKRFFERNKGHMRKAVEKAISQGNITDLGKDGANVSIPMDSVREPLIVHEQEGPFRRAFPWNPRFDVGDIIPRPPSGGGGGGDGQSDDGEMEDDFTFHISEDEFLEYLFDDLELPNMTKKSNAQIAEMIPVSAGFTHGGPWSRMSATRSFLAKKERTIAGDKKKREEVIVLLEESISILSRYAAPTDIAPAPQGLENSKQKMVRLEGQATALAEKYAAVVSDEDRARLLQIDEQLATLNRSRRVLGTWKDSDLRYRDMDQVPRLDSKAVMFCLMDVSGSMDEDKKNNAKVFYFLLYKFLKANYEQVNIHFIRHHHTAKEVDEQEFFYGTESGGTVVSTALEKMKEIMTQRYDSSWNIYGAQASDGDSSQFDNAYCQDLLRGILPRTQAYFYTEIGEPWGGDPTSLWEAYAPVRAEHPDTLYMGKIKTRNDVLGVFRELFKKKELGAPAAGMNP